MPDTAPTSMPFGRAGAGTLGVVVARRSVLQVVSAVTFISAAFGFVEQTRIGEGHRAQMAIGDDGAVIIADVAVTSAPRNRAWSRRLFGCA